MIAIEAEMPRLQQLETDRLRTVCSGCHPAGSKSRERLISSGQVDLVRTYGGAVVPSDKL
ncbi:hypothetical protein HYU93_03430 [Candidatus Daviesbacteria bacterium]|nr:hypothetical protein [Candidatus Daviesbacteria bacterium]